MKEKRNAVPKWESGLIVKCICFDCEL